MLNPLSFTQFKGQDPFNLVKHSAMLQYSVFKTHYHCQLNVFWQSVFHYSLEDHDFVQNDRCHSVMSGRRSPVIEL